MTLMKCTLLTPNQNFYQTHTLDKSLTLLNPSSKLKYYQSITITNVPQKYSSDEFSSYCYEWRQAWNCSNYFHINIAQVKDTIWGKGWYHITNKCKYPFWYNKFILVALHGNLLRYALYFLERDICNSAHTILYTCVCMCELRLVENYIPTQLQIQWQSLGRSSNRNNLPFCAQFASSWSVVVGYL